MLSRPLKHFWVLSCALMLPAAPAAEPAAKVAGTGAVERPLSDYRYHNDRVKLEKLEDKGLTYEKVRPAKPIEPGRPRPPTPFSATSRKPGQAGSVAAQRVPVQLLEEAGLSRSPAAVSFGFPLPQGALFDLANVRLVSPAGQEIAAQFTATSFWPDDSLKWVLIDCAVPLTARQALDCAVEFGSQIKRGPAASSLNVEANAASIAVVTGPLKVQLDKQRFHLFSAVWLDANDHGRYAGVVISPAGKIAGFHAGIKLDQPAPQAEPKKETNHRQELSGRGTITVQPDPDDTGKVWSLALMAGGDIYCQLQGVPPYLTRRAEECASPDR